MKRKLTLILLSVLLVATLFVSCNVETNEPENGTVTLRFRTDDEKRSLTASRTSLGASQYTWYYEAKKTDADTTKSPATGTKAKTKVGEDGKLTNEVGPFSLGEWDFTLYAYNVESNTEDTALVYKGTVTGYMIEEDTKTIDITVEPQKGGTGTLVIDKDIKLTDTNNATFSATSVTISGVDVTGYNNTFTFNSTSGHTLSSLTSGSYKITAVSVNNGITNAKNTIFVNVWNGLTTTISGTLDEITIKARFNAVTNANGSKEQSMDLECDTNATYVFDYSPAGNGYSTSISGIFTKNEDEANTPRLSVKTYGVSAANTTFTVTGDNEAVVNGIDLTLTNAKIMDGTTVKVTTTITAGLTEPKLYHKSSSNTATTMTKIENESAVDEVNEWWYDSNSGKLVFITDSFSSFYVSSTDTFIDITNNSVCDFGSDENSVGWQDYISYNYALNKAKAAGATLGDPVFVLLKDVKITNNEKNNYFTISQYYDGQSLTIDLAGHKIECDANDVEDRAALLFMASNSTLNIKSSKEGGQVVSTAGNGINIQAPDSKVVIGNNVTVTGVKHGVFIMYAATLDLYGAVTTSSENGEFAIGGNGSNTDKDNDTIINIYDGAIVTCTGGTAIYHPQVGGTLNIYGGTITGKNAAVEMRAGYLNISKEEEDKDAPELKATANSFTYKSNSNGSTTVGAALAIAQHTTKQEITVNISAGTFSGYHALSVQNPENNSQDDCNKVSVTVTGGTFTSSQVGGTVANIQNSAPEESASAGYFTETGTLPTTGSTETVLYTVKGTTATE